jgi:hypothetical protein
MIDRSRQPGGSGQKESPQRNDAPLERSGTARIINAITFVSVIFFLALWITVFLVLKDVLLTSSYSGNLLTDLTCITFFGGLVIAILAGAMVGNLLRRLLWKALIRRGK